MLRTRVVEHETRLEIVETIQNQIHAVDVVLDVRGVHIINDGFNGNSGIDTAKFGGSGDGFRKILTNVILIIERLTLKIGKVHEIAVDDAQHANTGSRQQFGRSAAQGAGANDRDAGSGDLCL